MNRLTLILVSSIILQSSVAFASGNPQPMEEEEEEIVAIYDNAYLRTKDNSLNLNIKYLKTIINKYYIEDITDAHMNTNVMYGILGALDKYSYLITNTKDFYIKEYAKKLDLVIEKNPANDYTINYVPQKLKKLFKVEDIIRNVNASAVNRDMVDFIVYRDKGEVPVRVFLSKKMSNITCFANGQKLLITVKSFSSNLRKEILSCSNNFVNEKTQEEIVELIFDIRNTKGEDLLGATRTANMFIQEGFLGTIFYKNSNEMVFADKNLYESNMPEHVSIIQNINTEGPGEFFSLIMKSYKIATIVGEKSGGRNTMQAPIYINDAGVNGHKRNAKYILYITHGYFLGPNHENIADVGVSIS